MRIGLLVESFDPRRGGVEQWTCQFAWQLRKAGHEVHIVAGYIPEQAAQVGFALHRVQSNTSKIGFAAEAEATLRRLDLDVVHDMGYGWSGDVFQPHGGSRFAAVEQNLLLLPRWARGLKRYFSTWLPRYREFDRLLKRQYRDDSERIFLPLSRMVARHLHEYHQVPLERMRLVYNGVDTERFSPAHRAIHRAPVRAQLRVADHEVLLLLVAHNFALKGVPTALAAVGKLHAEGLPVRFVVAGRRNAGRYLRLAERCGAAKVCQFVGSVDDPVPLYSAADAYLQPTFYDPCSLVVLEALASGLPVVTTRFNGASELLTEGQEGFVIDDPANAVELAAPIRKLFDSTRRESMGAAARRLAERHSFDRNCQEILAVYHEVIARREQRGINQARAA